jgi:REP element-mobilizing transposase RayT
MARKPRNEFEAGVYHVWARGNNRSRIFFDDPDREVYLRLLKETVERYGWWLLSYCLMSNHVHLVVETREPNLGRGMGLLHSRYAQKFNAKYGRVGHLFEDRYGNSISSDEARLTRAVGYVAANPVAAGLCARPQDWPWSSHGAVLAGRAPPWLAVDRLLFYYGSLRAYAESVAARVSARAA